MLTGSDEVFNGFLVLTVYILQMLKDVPVSHDQWPFTLEAAPFEALTCCGPKGIREVNFSVREKVEDFPSQGEPLRRLKNISR